MAERGSRIYATDIEFTVSRPQIRLHSTDSRKYSSTGSEILIDSARRPLRALRRSSPIGRLTKDISSISDVGCVIMGGCS